MEAEMEAESRNSGEVMPTEFRCPESPTVVAIAYGWLKFHPRRAARVSERRSADSARVRDRAALDCAAPEEDDEHEAEDTRPDTNAHDLRPAVAIVRVAR